MDAETLFTLIIVSIAVTFSIWLLLAVALRSSSVSMLSGKPLLDLCKQWNERRKIKKSWIIPIIGKEVEEANSIIKEAIVQKTETVKSADSSQSDEIENVPSESEEIDLNTYPTIHVPSGVSMSPNLSSVTVSFAMAYPANPEFREEPILTIKQLQEEARIKEEAAQKERQKKKEEIIQNEIKAMNKVCRYLEV